MKKTYLIIFVLSLIFVSKNQIASADSLPNTSDSYEGLIGYAENEFYFGEETSHEQTDSMDGYDITSLTVSTDQVTLEYNACIAFVDIIGRLEDGRYVNLTRLVEYAVENEDIASFTLGKVKGINQGTTEITVSYHDYSSTFTVEVLKYEPLVSIEELIGSLQSTITTYGAQPRVVWQDALTRANDMMNYEWTPTKDFIPNDQNMVLPKNKKLTGIPYSQGKQTNLAEFEAALGETDFYDPYYRDKEKKQRDPKYGLDCSGFLSAAWNIPRETTASFFQELKNGETDKFVKVGYYDITSNDSAEPTAAILKIAYTYLTPACGLLTRTSTGGHARFVVSINGEIVTCIDTSNNFPTLERYSFDKLAEGHYLPFTFSAGHFNSGWISW